MRKIYGPKGLSLLLLSALALGAVDFFAAYGPALGQARREAALLRSHLAYALAQQDEMELIDWGRSLSASLPGAALSARFQGRRVLSVGDLGRLGPGNAQGFHFPDRWRSRAALPLPGGGTLETDFDLPLSPDPWWPALGNALALLTLGLWSLRPPPRAATPDPPPPPREIPAPPGPAEDPADPARLEVDGAYRIVSTTPAAEALFGQELPRLAGRHFFDLLPTPELLEAMRSGRSEKVPVAFRAPEVLTAWVAPREKGWDIRLEPVPEPQNR